MKQVFNSIQPKQFVLEVYSNGEYLSTFVFDTYDELLESVSFCYRDKDDTDIIDSSYTYYVELIF